MSNNVFDMLLNSVCKCFMRVFPSILIREIDQQFSVLWWEDIGQALISDRQRWLQKRNLEVFLPFIFYGII